MNKLNAPLTKENAPNRMVMATRVDCGIQNARAKNQCRDTAQGKATNFGSANTVLGGVIRIELAMVFVFSNIS
ncbi:MAG: hypothetical protein IPM07_30380 [Anaerolineales bacterium]|nr:hypothetical protein [Anaerolineales bacterium]